MDTSSLIAACGSSEGASRGIFRHASNKRWQLLCSPYALRETDRNAAKFGDEVSGQWLKRRTKLRSVADMWVHDQPVVFDVLKDRPILFTAAAHAEFLITLDRRDSRDRLGRSFNQLQIRTPAEFLEERKLSGDLIPLPE